MSTRLLIVPTTLLIVVVLQAAVLLVPRGGPLFVVSDASLTASPAPRLPLDHPIPPFSLDDLGRGLSRAQDPPDVADLARLRGDMEQARADRLDLATREADLALGMLRLLEPAQRAEILLQGEPSPPRGTRR